MQIWSQKPQELDVEAEKITKDNVETLAAWCGGYPVETFDAIIDRPTEVGINVPGLDGSVRATEGQYLVRNPVSGRFYARNAREFEAQFDLKSL